MIADGLDWLRISDIVNVDKNQSGEKLNDTKNFDVNDSELKNVDRRVSDFKSIDVWTWKLRNNDK